MSGAGTSARGAAAPGAVAADPARRMVRFLTMALGALILGQALYVTDARLQDLVTGAAGIADMLRRSFPPDIAQLPDLVRPTIETIDIAIFGTVAGVILALPLAILAARNVSPARILYFGSRGVIAFTRAVPELIWALLFVTAVGLGPFPGALALAFHSLGMLGRLFAEVIEDMDMGPVEALTLTGASRLQVFTHAVVPGVLPSLLGIVLYRFDENLRSSVILGFVGAGGIGFQLSSAVSLFQYRQVSLLIIIILVLVIGAERMSAYLRQRVL